MNKRRIKQESIFSKVFLIAIDIAIFSAAFNLSHFIWINKWHADFGLIPELIIILMVIVGIEILFNNYSLSSRDMNLYIPERFIVSSTIVVTLSVSITFVMPARYEGGILGRGPFLLGLLLFISQGYIYRKIILWFFIDRSKKIKLLFVSSLKAGDSFFEDLQKLNRVVTISFLYDPDLKKKKSKNLMDKINNCAIIQKSDSWEKINQYKNNQYDAVVLGLNATLPDQVINQIMSMRIEGQAVYDISEFYEIMLNKIPVFHIKEGWFVFSTGFNILHEPIRMKIKRIMDVLLSLSFLFMSFPVWIITALLIKLESPGAVIFSQERTGYKDKPFVVYKFRSMRKDAEKDGAQWASQNDSRVTRVGKIIRLVRIDELPQLWNVLKGDMSFIGPRPERPVFIETLEKEIPYYNLRHLVKPGITGWAQVMYPYGASVEDAKEKLEYDLFYIKNYSLILDIKIIFKTIRIVLFGKGR